MTDRGSGSDRRARSARSAAVAFFVVGVADLVVLNGAFVPRYLAELEGGAAIAFAAPVLVEETRRDRLVPPPLDERGTPPRRRARRGEPEAATRPPTAPEPTPVPERQERADEAPRSAPDSGETADRAPALEAVAPILFPTGSSELEREGRRRLWTVAWILRRETSARVLLRGVGDPGADRAAAFSLGRARAEEAAAFLVSQGHIEASRIEAAGAAAISTTAEAGAEAGQVEVVWR